MQSFGDNWTLIKLNILEKYLGAYTNALKKQNFNLIYIDAFCGCGKNEKINSQGSPLIALNYYFNEYIFVDKKQEYIEELKNCISGKDKYSGKNIIYINKDCNEFIRNIKLNKYDRGVIFLDPYGMQLNWQSLEYIAKTGKLDVWYLFPLSGLVRCLKLDRKIDDKTSETITMLLGTKDWQEDIYNVKEQLNFFNEIEYQRFNINGVFEYVIKRFKSIFTGVCDNPILLKNSKNSKQFGLFFMCGSSNPKAVDLALKLSKHILNKQMENLNV